MLQSAPPFESVAGDIASRLDGAVLVAHNISYDVRMLRQEVARLSSVDFDPGEGLCTYRLTKKKLALAAASAGLPEPNHTALADARTVAALVGLHAPRDGPGRLHAASWTPMVTGSGSLCAAPEHRHAADRCINWPLGPAGRQRHTSRSRYIWMRWTAVSTTESLRTMNATG